jgi:hypothetical protein
VERLSAREKERISELLAEGAPLGASVAACDSSRSDGDTAATEAGTEPIAVATVAGGARRDLAWDRGRRFAAVDRASVGSVTFDGVT